MLRSGVHASLWLRFGVIAVSLSAAGGVLAAGAGASKTPRVPAPCALLTSSEVSSVGVAHARRRSIPNAELPPAPPNGTGCDWISPDTAHRSRTAIFGVAVGLWDFRTAGATWTTRWGSQARRYAVSVCNQQAPRGSGVTLPATRVVRRVGDYACTTDVATKVAKGPFYLVVSVGAGRVGDTTRNAAINLAKKAAQRLHA